MEIISLFEHSTSLQDIKMVDLLPRNQADDTPFNVCYMLVAPNQKTKEHRHDERESFLILSGEGNIDSESNLQKVKAGDLIHFDPFESHSLVNTGVETLSFLTIYWRDYKSAFQSAAKHKTRSDEPIYITSGPPTPNGNLHLGHLSGPFLGADAYTRYMKMSGQEAYNISWSDDFQTGVFDKSEQLGLLPQEVADRFTEEIQQTLKAMNILVDMYLRPSLSKEYQEGLAEFFDRCWQNGAIIQKSSTEFFDPLENRFLQESDIKGFCPNCLEHCTGNLCEECGHPHSCVEVVDALLSRSNAKPIKKELERLYLPLKNFADQLKNHHDHSLMRSRLRGLFDQLNENQLPDFPITYPSCWGVPAPIKSLSKQAISAWFEMAFAFLFSIKKLEKQNDPNFKTISFPKKGRIVHFFGFDNSFYYTVLFPSIYFSAFPNQTLKIDYVCNEFYLLNGSKFSTSRQHVMSGEELLEVASSDEIRFYLAYTRPEINRTNFTKEAFCQFIETEFGRWKQWLLDLDSRIKKFFGGNVPEAGLWTNEQKIFFSSLEDSLRRISKFYEVESFSLEKASQSICHFVDECIYFSEGEKHWPLSIQSHPQFRTSIALEVTAANLLAILVYPLMPLFSANLWKQLGNRKDLQTMGWPQTPPFAAPNSQVNLADLSILRVLHEPIRNQRNLS